MNKKVLNYSILSVIFMIFACGKTEFENMRSGSSQSLEKSPNASDANQAQNAAEAEKNDENKEEIASDQPKAEKDPEQAKKDNSDGSEDKKPSPPTDPKGAIHKIAANAQTINLHQNGQARLTLTLTNTSDETVDLKPSFGTLPSNILVEMIDDTGTAMESVQLPKGDKNIELKISHQLSINNGTVSAELPSKKMLSIDMVDGENIGSESAVNVEVNLSKTLLVNLVDPASAASNRMVEATTIAVPKEVGICLVNNYKAGLRLHGSPHQGPGGMAMNQCYDKYSGDNLSEGDFADVTTCEDAQKVGEQDTMYDHDSRATSGDFTVSCN